jgi:hypothetical protein
MEPTGSSSASSPSSMVGREGLAAGGFPSRESALMREGLTGGKVQREAGGAFMPSNLARAYSSSLQKRIDGSAFRGMIAAAGEAAAAAEAEEEAKAEAAAEEAGLLHTLCNFVARWRRRAAPGRNKRHRGGGRGGKCALTGTSGISGEWYQSNWFEKSLQEKTACSSVVSTGITTNYFARVKKRRKKDLGTGEERPFEVGFPSGAHLCVNISTSLSVMLPPQYGILC